MGSSPSIIAIIPAAGIGKRMNATKPKQFLTINDEPILVITLKALAKCNKITKFIVPSVDLVYTKKILKSYASELDITVVPGGKTRQESVDNGLSEVKKLAESGEIQMPDLIMVHDAVRALVQLPIIETVIDKAMEVGGAIAASQVTDTLKMSHSTGNKKDCIKKNIARDHMWVAQTPQVYNTDLLIQAYDKAKKDHYLGTDSAGLIERLGQDVILVESPKSNIKLTTPDDLILAEIFLNQVN